MPVSADVIGTELPPLTMTIDPGRVRFFAKAIGECLPDGLDAADIAVPPTFLFALELEQTDPFAWLTALGVDLSLVLHGSQQFIYHTTAKAGDTLIARPRIVDVYSKKSGALEFIVKQTAVTRKDGTPVADLVSTLVIRHPEAAR
ncbi:FAS1-like dehydratase domain-containing protein [Nocardia amikacinitolerans]|uniref:FAS1-like dehydratase domain-containing protein n=1 Tax=Nocardia amikacinitolerans TaxID=756689 RepID=UPI0020A3D8A6|nr:MaoC family dehydratase N-terminal domain-containing protein [Nocardia amikacinitolerans]MCP2281038.1 N-terminal half of MaoC dehydratase [Nocardia amikacinitolerans]MCP2300061.1 N-terminal half of MaoC dehydratase [Nocardia amikacinitolerans]